MKKYILISLLLSLTACGGSGGKSEKPSETRPSSSSATSVVTSSSSSNSSSSPKPASSSSSSTASNSGGNNPQYGGWDAGGSSIAIVPSGEIFIDILNTSSYSYIVDFGKAKINPDGVITAQLQNGRIDATLVSDIRMSGAYIPNGGSKPHVSFNLDYSPKTAELFDRPGSLKDLEGTWHFEDEYGDDLNESFTIKNSKVETLEGNCKKTTTFSQPDKNRGVFITSAVQSGSCTTAQVRDFVALNGFVLLGRNQLTNMPMIVILGFFPELDFTYVYSAVKR